MAGDKTRVTFDVNMPMKKILDELAEESGVTQAEVLRRAVALLSTVKKAQREGEGEPAIAKNGLVVAKLVGI